jgi:hypothetical protein
LHITLSLPQKVWTFYWSFHFSIQSMKQFEIDSSSESNWFVFLSVLTLFWLLLALFWVLQHFSSYRSRFCTIQNIKKNSHHSTIFSLYLRCDVRD